MNALAPAPLAAAGSGIDGLNYFKPDSKTTERAIVSVKGGDNVNVAMIRDLKGVLNRENPPVGICITPTPVTVPMVAEAASAGFFECDFGKFERLQVFTVAELLKGAKPKLPLVNQSAAFKKAKVEGSDKNAQGKLLLARRIWRHAMARAGLDSTIDSALHYRCFSLGCRLRPPDRSPQQKHAQGNGQERDRCADAEIGPETNGNALAPGPLHHDQVGDRTQNSEIAG